MERKKHLSKLKIELAETTWCHCLVEPDNFTTESLFEVTRVYGTPFGSKIFVGMMIQKSSLEALQESSLVESVKISYLEK